MKTLPRHPNTGLLAIGIGKRGPIWPIMGGSGEGEPLKGATATATPPEPAVATAPAAGDEPLGDGGKRALEAERRRATAAEKAKAALEAKVAAFEDAQKTEAEKTAERIAELEKGAKKALRYEAAEKAEISLALAGRLKGDTLEEMVADAEELKKLIGAVAPANPATPTVPPAPKPDRRQGGGEAGNTGSMASGKALYEARKNKK